MKLTPLPAKTKLALGIADPRFRPPVRLKTLQNWEIGRVVSNPYAAAFLADFLKTHPKVSIKRDPSKAGPKPFNS